MFSFPVSVPFNRGDGIFPLTVNVEIDKVAVVQPLLDKGGKSGVLLSSPSSLIPQTEIIFEDGRKLPVLEATAIVLKYLDLYRELEGFYTGRAATVEDFKGGNVVPLFQGGPCPPTPHSGSSEGSTPA